MKCIFLSLLLALSFLGSSQVKKNWCTVKTNDLSDPAFKKFPDYIEVDLSLVGTIENVKVECNKKDLKPIGNRFFIPFDAYSSTTSWIGSTSPDEKITYYECKNCENYYIVELLPEGKVIYNAKCAEEERKWKKKIVKEIPYLKVESKQDSIIFNEEYKCYFVIDTLKIKNLSKIEISYFDFPLERRKNKFKYSGFTWGPKVEKIDFVIINTEGTVPDTSILELPVYHKPLKKKRSNDDYVGYSDPMPVFKVAKYNSFMDYIEQSAKEQGLKLYGTYQFDYTVLKNGKTRFEGLKYGSLSFDEEDKLEVIINSCNFWIPGIWESKVVNVRKQEKYSFY